MPALSCRCQAGVAVCVHLEHSCCLQMGPKAKAKAKGQATAKGPPKAKAQGKAKATAKATAKAQGPAPALGSRGGKGWDAIQAGQPMGQLGAQAIKDHLNSLVAANPSKNQHLLEHYEGLRKHSDKLSFALQLKVDREGSFLTATETHSTATVDKAGFEDGWLEDSIVASKLGLTMWATDQIHQDRLTDQLNTMEKRPHENPALAAKGHMQYK